MLQIISFVGLFSQTPNLENRGISYYMSKIKWIYFDIGGVAIQDFSGTNKWQQLLRDLHISQAKEPLIDSWWVEHIQPRVDLDLKIDDQLEDFQKISGITLPSNYSLHDDFIARFNPNPHLWPLTTQLKQRFKLGLLTNMYPGMFNKIQNAKLLPPVSWDVVVDSSVVGFKKPDPKIYHLAKQKAAVPHEQILFIDNVQENLEYPKHLGWQTFWYDSKDYEKSSNELDAYLKQLL
jgi:HAD superfamily hydrolase (TIGR01509 family)